jgi:hypothetical protein
MWDRDLKKQLCLRKERTSGRVISKTVKLEVTKQAVAVELSVRLQKVSDWTVWRRRSPLK